MRTVGLYLLLLASLVGCASDTPAPFARFSGRLLAMDHRFLYYQDAALDVRRCDLQQKAAPLYDEGVCHNQTLVAHAGAPLEPTQFVFSDDHAKVLYSSGATPLTLVSTYAPDAKQVLAGAPLGPLVTGLGAAWSMQGNELVRIHVGTGDMHRMPLASSGLGAFKQLAGNPYGVGALYERGLLLSNGEAYPIKDVAVEAVAWNQRVVMFLYATPERERSWYFCMRGRACGPALSSGDSGVSPTWLLASGRDGNVQALDDVFLFANATGELTYGWVEAQAGRQRRARMKHEASAFERAYSDGTDVFLVHGQEVVREALMPME